MKKILLSAFAMAVLLSSCSKNEVIDAQGSSTQPEIGFSTYMGTTTKATPLVNTAFLDFQVYAYHATAAVTTTAIGAVYIPGSIVKRTSSSAAWQSYVNGGTVESKYYWPIGNVKLNFFAFAPSVTAGTLIAPTYAVSGASVPTLTYEAPSASADQTDIVVAQMVNQASTTLGSNTTTPTVTPITLSFTHALTQVKFTVQGEAVGSTDALLEYNVTEIKLNNVKNKGIFTFPITNDGKGTWTDNTSVGTGYVYCTGVTYNVTGVTSITCDEQLLLIPLATDGVTVTVKYTVTQANVLIATHTKTVALTGTWTPNTKVTYALELPVDANGISFEATSSEWGIASGGIGAGGLVDPDPA